MPRIRGGWQDFPQECRTFKEEDDVEISALEASLNAIPIAGFRGHAEMQGGTMKDWGKAK
ncbi:MAG: hypothetical protein IJ849_04630 [Selenomonadaceae bacterium]|nr:hypothetical protein [Selenomonadaceae bacterium]